MELSARMRNRGSAQQPWNDHVPIVSEMEGPVATGLADEVVELVELVEVEREVVDDVDEVEVDDVVDVVREVLASVAATEGATDEVPAEEAIDDAPIWVDVPADATLDKPAT